ncbi:MAG: PepSY domain-containing protein [Caulobacteraceae bacterium]
MKGSNYRGKAKQTVLAPIKDGVFKIIELEDKDGVIVYEVEIQPGIATYDVKVDCKHRVDHENGSGQ